MEGKLSKFIVDAYQGRVSNYSREDANEVIKKAFVDICGTDKLDHKTFRRHRIEIFEVMEEVLDQLIVDGWENNPFFQQFVDYKNVNFGDKNAFYVEDKSVLSVAKFSGSHWDIRRQRLTVGQEISIETSAYGVKVYEEFKRLLAGRVDFVTLIQKVEKAFENHIMDTIYASFMGASANLPAPFKKNGGFTEDGIGELVDHVSASAGTRDLVIVGTRTAISKITNTTDFISNDMKNEKNQLGYIKMWNGVKIMPIEQVHKAGTFEFAIDNKKLFVLPANAKPVKFVTEGEAIMKEVDETTNMDRSREYMVEKNYGVGVIFNCAYGVYELA